MIEDQEFYWQLLDTLKDGVYFANIKRKVTYWNKAAEEITGYKAAEVLGKHCADNILVHIDEKGNNLCTGTCPLANVIKSGEPIEENIYLHHKNGHRVPVHVRVNPVKNKNGEIMGAVEIFSDRLLKILVDQRMQELKKMDLLDSHTGLPNRRFLEMNLETRLSELRQYNWSFGILYFNITQPAGKDKSPKAKKFDEVLKIVAKTFISNCNLFDVIGRWEDEGFVGIFGNVDQEKFNALETFYRVILKKTDLSSTGIIPLIKIGAALAEPEDKAESILDRAKRRIKTV